MSDQPGYENYDTDLGSYSVDDDDQLQPDDTLVQEDVADPLDRGYSPPDKPQGVDAWGTTAYEQAHEETIDMRIRQEVPDPNTAYGAPDDESGLDGPDPDDLQGDDPDSERAADAGFYDGDEVGDARTGRLVAPDEGSHEDVTKELLAEDVGVAGAGASAEEAAMHTIGEDELDQQ